MERLLPDVNREFAGISDVAALQFEVDSLRDRLANTTAQASTERLLADQINTARAIAVLKSPALQLIFDIDNLKDLDISASQRMSVAFLEDIESTQLPDGLVDSVSRDLRVNVHPDSGGDTETAQAVGQSLDKANDDPSFAIASALLKASNPNKLDRNELLKERYRLSVVLANTKTGFDDEEQAQEIARREIEGAEWRVRMLAAFKSVALIMGDSDVWLDFLYSINRQNNSYLIDLVNRLQPELFAINERMAKGDPKALSQEELESVDGIFERIWSTLNKKDSPIPYSPPYQNWLPILIPAMRILDPGNKPGESYTQFRPPIQFVSVPRYRANTEPINSISFKKYDNDYFSPVKERYSDSYFEY